MDFGEILTRAWQVIWKHKILWLFGFLANCGGQLGSNFSNSTNYRTDAGEFDRLPFPYAYEFESWLDSFPREALFSVLFGLFCLVLLLGLVFWVLSTFGRIGLIKGTQQVEGGAEGLALRQLYHDSLPFMWRALGLSLLIFFVFLGIGIIVAFAVAALTVATLGIVWICLIPLLCLLIPLGWFVAIVIQQMNVALVVEDLGIGEAITRGWGIVRENIGSFVVMGLILVIGGVVVSVVIAIPMFFVLAPLFASMFGAAATGSSDYLGGGLAVTLICLVLYLPVLLVAGGFLRAYIESAWTLTFLRLTGTSAEAEQPA